METMYEELDEAKAEIEKLKAEYKVKVELSESLKRAHNEQLIKIQENSSKVEKLTWELYEKEDEISSAKQLSEDLKSSLKEKEAIIKQLSSANDKLRARCDEKVQRYEEENRMLALALEEANTKNADLEQQISLLKGEIEGLKGLVSVSRKKNSETEKTAKISKELRQRDNALLNLEEENRKFEDQLKWKKEQFNHLEEAYEKLGHQFKVKEKEWEKERDELLDEISKLQENLNSQIRISEGLQNRLQMCNQALAHEESKRKYLEVQLSDSKTCFDNVLAEYEEAKSKIENLTGQRDDEIASLRDSLGTKEMLYKEMEYQLRRLELEKQELVLSLKEFQEAQIQEAGNSSSLSKLRNKLRALEKMHGECLTNLKAKEVGWQSQSEKLMEELHCSKSELECKNISIQELKEKVEQVYRECATILEDNDAKWHSQLESLKQDLGVCRSELENRNTTIRELKREVEACDSLILQLELQNEETSLMYLVLRSEFSEAQLKLVDDYADMNLKNKERKEWLSLLSKQLEMKNTALVKAQKDTEEEREKVEKVEQVQRECATILEVNEAKWNSHFESLKQDLGVCRSELENQNTTIRELKREVEACDSLILKLEFQNEETSLMFLVLRSEFSEAQLKLVDDYADMDLKNKESKERLSILSTQLEMKNTALMKAQKEIEEEREKVVCLARKVESLNLIGEEQLPLQKELARQKEMLNESYKCRLHLEEQLLSMKRDLSNVQDALDRANEELADKFCEANEAEFELQIWKSIAEQLKASLEENRKMRREVEASLLAEAEIELNLKQERESLVHVIKEKDKTIGGLQKQLNMLNQEMYARNANIVCVSEAQKVKEKSMSEELQIEVEWWEQEWLRKEIEGAILAQVDSARNHEQESFHHLVQERDQRIDDLQQLVRSLEQEFKSSTRSFATRLSEMQVEINMFHKAWEKITQIEVLKEIEIQQNNLVIAELESDLSDFQEEVEQLEKSLLNSEVRREDLEAELQAKLLVIKSLTCRLEDSVNLSSERENLLSNMEGLCDRISMLSGDDMQLMETLTSLVQTFDTNMLGIDGKKDEFFDPIKENMDLHASPVTKKAVTILDQRSPLRALNN